MKSKIIRSAAVGVVVLAVTSVSLWAFEGPQRDGRRGPPPEAIEACKDKSEGTSVEITTPRGDKIKAACKQVDGQMVAVPEGGFRGPKGMPPGGR